MTAGTDLPRHAVPAAFDRAARDYDRLVGLNPGYHAHLRSAARVVARTVGPGARVLDAGCGTGASTEALLATLVDPDVVAVDASEGMLAIARRKVWPGSVRFVHAAVDDLPVPAASGPFDAVFAAYLLRNVVDPDATLATLRRLLRPGGVLVLHDYSLAERPLPRLRWTAVCWTIVIPAAWLISRDTRLHRYLWRSARGFDSPERLQRRLLAAGYPEVRHGTTSGWQRGILHTVTATVPPSDHRGAP
ncbi:class I SAM-dependent methyltransferase [Saccharomonospora glauca]|uniref:Methylase involved in ubiquinone/menaquinone biosynthesis n=1 Tax=Saccharomonospora glauca K62 TaxID=928724 RepID=I1D192_9PSEU|nr:class I SAM-dependent methyltransferase [Saccharomonospora glauca]EIE98716.1 methylase involved in ubiquinone/menaquinone biosynthesis [Saccharomonospora glauca K62]